MTHEVYVLPEDRAYAEQRIRELEQKIQELGADFNDAFTQSSETWHDNSPFEAVRDKQATYAAELHHLRTLIRHCTLKAPRRTRGAVNIGSIVTVESGQRYRIAGDWTHRAGRHEDGATWISSKSPLAQALLGKRIGETLTINQVTHTIAEIDS